MLTNAYVPDFYTLTLHYYTAQSVLAKFLCTRSALIWLGLGPIKMTVSNPVYSGCSLLGWCEWQAVKTLALF